MRPLNAYLIYHKVRGELWWLNWKHCVALCHWKYVWFLLPKELIHCLYILSGPLLPYCLFIILFALLNVRRAEITLVNSCADWFWLVWEFYIWEAWQQAHVVGTATWSQCVNAVEQQAAWSKFISRAAAAGFGYPVLLISAVRYVLLEIRAHCMLGAMERWDNSWAKFSVLLLVHNIVFTDLYWNTKHTSTSQDSCRAPHIQRGFNPSLKRTNTFQKYFLFFFYLSSFDGYIGKHSTHARCESSLECWSVKVFQFLIFQMLKYVNILTYRIWVEFTSSGLSVWRMQIYDELWWCCLVLIWQVEYSCFSLCLSFVWFVK